MPTATRAVVSMYLSIEFPPLWFLRGCTRCRFIRSLASLAADPLEQNRENEKGADEDALPIGVDAGHEERIADDLEKRRADEGAEGRALAAHEVGAADDGRGDGAQLVARAEGIDGGAGPADREDRGDGRRQARDDIGLELDALHRDAGE